MFPYYIVHQTAIVVVAHEVAKYDLPLGVEVGAIILATLATCALTFEAVRRVPWLRPLFGLKHHVGRSGAVGKGSNAGPPAKSARGAWRVLCRRQSRETP
jgi:hypothetical protein